jgi:hypothetical protein
LKIRDPKDRQRVQDAILSVVSGHSQMAEISKLLRNAKAQRDSQSQIDTERLQKLYDKLNPHKHTK